MYQLSEYYYALTQASAIQIVKWCVFVGITIALAISLHLQNKRYASAISDDPLSKQLLIVARARGLIACMMVGMLLLFLITRDVEHMIAPLRTHPARGSTASIASPEATSTYILEDERAQQPPSVSVPDMDASMDAVKTAYEDAFISFMILRQCSAVSDKTYRELYQQMQTALAESDEAGLAANNIIIAASGSYQSLYYDAPCTEAYIDKTADNLDAFLREARSN